MIFCDIIQDFAALLYEAAKDEGYIDPSKVEEILGISPEEVRSMNTANEKRVHQTPRTASVMDYEEDDEDEELDSSGFNLAKYLISFKVARFIQLFYSLKCSSVGWGSAGRLLSVISKRIFCLHCVSSSCNFR